MITTEAAYRRANEELFLQYLKGIQTNAFKNREANRTEFDLTDVSPEMSYAYLRYARADEKSRTINMILDAYQRIINGGVIDEKDPLFK